MAHFAKIDSNNMVTEVVVISNDVIKDESGKEVEQLGINFMKELYGEGTYKQTSYNGNLRKNMARKGGTYDEGRDSFINPKPFSSWVLDESTCIWKAPKDLPSDSDTKRYQWNESLGDWKKDTAT